MPPHSSGKAAAAVGRPRTARALAHSLAASRPQASIKGVVIQGLKKFPRQSMPPRNHVYTSWADRMLEAKLQGACR